MQSEDNQTLVAENENLADNTLEDFNGMDDGFLDSDDHEMLFADDNTLDDMPTSKQGTPELRRNIEDLLEQKRLKQRVSDIFDDEEWYDDM